LSQIESQSATDAADVIALNHYHRGVDLQEENDLFGALREYKKAIDIFEALRSKTGKGNKERWLEGLAMTYRKRGRVKYHLGQISNAQKEYERAIALYLEIRSRGDGKFTEAMADNLAMAYTNRGEIKSYYEKFQEAIQDFSETITIYTELAARMNSDVPIRSNNTLAWAYQQRGYAKHCLGETEAAIQDYDQSIAAYQTFGDNFDWEMHPDAFIGMASAYDHRGMVHEMMGNHIRAIKDCDQAILRLRKAQEVMGESFFPDMANNLARLFTRRGDCYMRTRAIKRATKDYGSAIEIYDVIDNIDGLSATLLKRAIAYYQQADWGKAIEDCELSTWIGKILRDRKRSDLSQWEVEDRIATAYQFSGRGKLEICDHKGAAKDFAASTRSWEKIRKRMRRHFTPAIAEKLSASYKFIGILQLHKGDTQMATETWQKAVALIEPIEDSLNEEQKKNLEKIRYLIRTVVQ